MYFFDINNTLVNYVGRYTVCIKLLKHKIVFISESYK